MRNKSNYGPCWMCSGGGRVYNSFYISKIFKKYSKDTPCPVCDQVRLIHIKNHVDPLSFPDVTQQQYNEDGL